MYESSSERWSPVQSVEKILLSVVSMLAGTKLNVLKPRSDVIFPPQNQIAKVVRIWRQQYVIFSCTSPRSDLTIFPQKMFRSNPAEYKRRCLDIVKKSLQLQQRRPQRKCLLLKQRRNQQQPEVPIPVALQAMPQTRKAQTYSPNQRRTYC